MQTEKNLADMTVIGKTKLESEIHDDDHDGDNESDKILAHHLVFSLLGFCPLGFIPATDDWGGTPIDSADCRLASSPMGPSHPHPRRHPHRHYHRHSHLNSEKNHRSTKR